MMATHTNHNLDFLSNEELINILRSLLEEIDVTVSSGAYRSTTYLSVSAIEGLFGELLKLLQLEPTGSSLSKEWPLADKKTKQPKTTDRLTLEEREKVLQANGALPIRFENLYAPIRVFRNYMHPERELRNQIPIDQSVALLALACLNAIIEKYSPLRFIAMQQWRLVYGIAQVPSNTVIHMPNNPGDPVSLLISELPAKHFRQLKFRVNLPPRSTFNLIYSYFSKDSFMGARIEARWNTDGGSFDNGLVRCSKWRAWSISGRYKNEPDPKQLSHIVQVDFASSGFTVTVDGKQLELNDDVDWNFDPEGKIGFMTEWGLISILDLEVQVK